MKILKIIGAIFLGLIVIGMFIPKDKTTAPAPSEPAKTEQTTAPSAPAEPPAPETASPTPDTPAPTTEPPVQAAIPDFLPVGETYTIDGGTIKAGLIEKAKIGFLDDDPGLCTLVEVANSTDNEWSVNPFEFSIIYPDNTRGGPEPITEKALHHTELLPGDVVAGKVCFKDEGQKGEHKIVYKPFWSDQLRWVVNIE